MKTPTIIFFLLTLISSIHALTIPSYADTARLFKRKGGGGGGGRGGGGSSSSGSRGSSSSSSSSRGSSSSGGRVAGVGPQPRTYGSGAYYGGGAARPYPAGRPTPGGIVPFVFLGAGVGFLAVGSAGYWRYGYQWYNYDTEWTYHNNTANENQTRPVSCYCNRYSDCACEEQDDQEYIDATANNATIARVADVNGTDTLLINGTLPNGTVAAEENAATGLKSGWGQAGGWVLISGAVGWGVWLL